MNINNLNYFIAAALSRSSGGLYERDDFTKEELLKLLSLSIGTTTSIEGISKLKNLQTLNIVSFDSIEYDYDQIIDYSELAGLQKLKSLVVANNAHIQRLDLTNLVNLETLIVVSNPNLVEIIGLENLTKLNRVVIVGNNVKEISGIEQYLGNTQTTEINVLDYKIFNSIYNNPTAYRLLHHMALSYETNVTFAEKIGIGELFTYSFNMINKMNAMAEVVLFNIVNDKMSDEEKVMAVYHYVIKNLTYDYERLGERRSYIHEHNKIPTYENNHKYINSSYEAFRSGRVVCEGYVNMLNFMLNKLGIESRTVYCGVKLSSEYQSGLYNHSANAIKLDGQWYYFDAQLEDKKAELRYFKKTLEEFSETHELSPSTKSLKVKEKIK